MPGPYCSALPPGDQDEASIPDGASFHYRDDGVGRGIPEDVVQRYLTVVQPARRPGAWYDQPKYGVRFRAGAGALGVSEVRGVLAHRRHIAVYAPHHGQTDYFAFDIDCRSDDRRSRDARYWDIRRLMGLQRVPLVYGTPSGAGLRVRYRIPLMPITRIITGRRTGLLADVLRAGGVEVADGAIEIFPQRNQADRLPLGCGMPLLDPDTLAPLPDAAIGAEYNQEMLRGGIEHLERWHAAVHEDLIPYLESLPGQPLLTAVSVERSTGAESFIRVGSRVRPSDATLRLVHEGLMASSTRYASEFRVALAGILAPEVLEPFGLANVDDDANVASAVAEWLASRHNGFSREWRESLCDRGQAGAITAWTQRYLDRSGATGQHFVGRARAAAAQLDGSLRSTLLITDRERSEIMQLAEHVGLRGSRLYRAEVWIAASRRAVKRIMRFHLRRGVPLQEVDDTDGRYVFVPIAARWMEGWAYGSGSSGRGTSGAMPNYIRYREILRNARWMRLARYSPTAAAFRRGLHPPGGLAYEASTYAVRVPRMDVRVRDVGVDALELRAQLAATALSMSGRPVGVDEAHHALWLSRSGIAVGRRYGHRLGARLQQIAQVLNATAGHGSA